MTVVDFSKYLEERNLPFMGALRDAYSGIYLFRLEDGEPRKIFHAKHEDICASSKSVDKVFDTLTTKLNTTSLADRQQDWLLVIPAENAEEGFSVEAICVDGHITGWFGGLQQELEDVSSVILWVKRAISSDYQLRIVFVSEQPREWYLEPACAHSSSSGMMQEFLASGYMTFFKSLRKTSTDIKRNRLLAGL